MRLKTERLTRCWTAVKDPEFVYIFTAEQEWSFAISMIMMCPSEKSGMYSARKVPAKKMRAGERTKGRSELAHIERREKGMSTRSMIAKQIAEDEYLAVYCHQDGYLSHNGALLLDCYNTPEKVDALLALGELSHLGKDMEAAPHEIADLKGMEGVTVAYCRDRGEAYRKAGILYPGRALQRDAVGVSVCVHAGACVEVPLRKQGHSAVRCTERPGRTVCVLRPGTAGELLWRAERGDCPGDDRGAGRKPGTRPYYVREGEQNEENQYHHCVCGGKAAALNLYLSQKTLTVEEELGKALDALYTKNVPAGVRSLLSCGPGSRRASASTPKAKKPKPSAPSAVGEVPAAQEVSSHEQH